MQVFARTSENYTGANAWPPLEVLRCLDSSLRYRKEDVHLWLKMNPRQSSEGRRIMV